MNGIEIGTKVTYVKKSDRAQDWDGTVLLVLEETSEVVVSWTGRRTGRKVRQVNPLEDIIVATDGE